MSQMYFIFQKQRIKEIEAHLSFWFLPHKKTLNWHWSILHGRHQTKKCTFISIQHYIWKIRQLENTALQSENIALKITCVAISKFKSPKVDAIFFFVLWPYRHSVAENRSCLSLANEFHDQNNWKHFKITATFMHYVKKIALRYGLELNTELIFILRWISSTVTSLIIFFLHFALMVVFNWYL